MVLLGQAAFFYFKGLLGSFASPVFHKPPVHPAGYLIPLWADLRLCHALSGHQPVLFTSLFSALLPTLRTPKVHRAKILERKENLSKLLVLLK